MTKNPAFESATAVLLDYVEDTEMFANAMNESTEGAALLDGGMQLPARTDRK